MPREASIQYKCSYYTIFKPFLKIISKLTKYGETDKLTFIKTAANQSLKTWKRVEPNINNKADDN